MTDDPQSGPTTLTDTLDAALCAVLPWVIAALFASAVAIALLDLIATLAALDCGCR